MSEKRQPLLTDQVLSFKVNMCQARPVDAEEAGTIPLLLPPFPELPLSQSVAKFRERPYRPFHNNPEPQQPFIILDPATEALVLLVSQPIKTVAQHNTFDDSMTEMEGTGEKTTPSVAGHRAGPHRDKRRTATD